MERAELSIISDKNRTTTLAESQYSPDPSSQNSLLFLYPAYQPVEDSAVQEGPSHKPVSSHLVDDQALPLGFRGRSNYVGTRGGGGCVEHRRIWVGGRVLTAMVRFSQGAEGSSRKKQG